MFLIHLKFALKWQRKTSEENDGSNAKQEDNTDFIGRWSDGTVNCLKLIVN